MKIKWKSKVIVSVIAVGLGVGVLSTGIIDDGVPRQACGCEPPQYIAHFTDAEAMNIIRTGLEDAGLIFDSEVPLYYVERWGGYRWDHHVGIDLFDEEKNIAITLINMFEDTTSSISYDGGYSHSRRTDNLETEFAENFDEVVFGVFYNPSIIREWRDQNHRRSLNVEEVELLTERLEVQIQEFIERLQDEGVIDFKISATGV